MSLQRGTEERFNQYILFYACYHHATIVVDPSVERDYQPSGTTTSTNGKLLCFMKIDTPPAFNVQAKALEVVYCGGQFVLVIWRGRS